MVGGYNELTPPSRYYTGPITGINATYGYPYTADNHCASCGSTDVSVPSSRNGVTAFRCNRCARITRFDVWPAGPDARYEIRVNGYTEVGGLDFSDLRGALWDVLMNLDPHFASEKASQYYGAYYDRQMRSDSAEIADALATDILWVNCCMAVSDRYVESLGIGEEYNLPDFPVSVVRVDDAKSGSAAKSNAGKPAKPKASGNRRTTASRRAASKPKTSKNVRKAPAKKTTKPKTRASARSASRRY